MMTSSPGIDQGEHGRHHALGRAAADGDVGIGVAIDAVERCALSGDGLAKDGAPQVMAYWLKPSWIALQAASLTSCGGVEIGHSLAEIDGAVLVAPAESSRG